MSFELRPAEKVILTVDFHWSTYLAASAHFLLFSVLAVIPWAATQYLARIETLGAYLPTLNEFMPYFVSVLLVIALEPLAFKWLQNRCKHYVLTNERLYVEDGVFSKTKRSVPIAAINDVVLNQSVFQRIVGTGSISVMTGNDAHCVIKNISYPDRFRRQLSRLLQEQLRQAS
ncbi:MAG: PH domain-containing protein [Bdellovibrionaceae bacterium]|nr:PH domain-containing protein [Bdellovibrionales bacterium]MCB9254332.1 PH domain-containing protein [Pseudobdellovibrionaceae bacterium]